MFLSLLFAAVLTVFSTAVLLYVSLATGLGPWIGPMMVMIVRFGRFDKPTMALITIISSFGGAIATGIGFSLPTLYFVDAATWAVWMAHPLWFCGMMAGLVVSAGFLGMYIAGQMAPALIADTTISFPVSAAINTTIESAYGPEESIAFGGGALFAVVIGFIRNGLWRCAGLVSGSWAVLPSVFGSTFIFELSPVCWAVGFLAGTGIVLPLLVGMVSKYVLVASLVYITSLQPIDVTFALCSGLLVSGFIKPLVYHPIRFVHNFYAAAGSFFAKTELVSGFAVASICLCFGMSLLGACFLAVVLVPLLYHLGEFAARTGLATYGRYMTLAMLPLMCIPGVSSISVIIACTLIGIAGGAVVDSLFSFKIAQHFQIDAVTLKRAQYSGVIVTALVVGVLMWLLCTHFTLGVAPLIAHRGISRALLMNTFQFNGFIVLIGIIYGFLLDWFGVNAAMVFGGLVMPNGLIIALAVGAAVRAIMRRHIERGTLFWSGVLAGDVMWILVSLMAGLL